MDNIKFEIVKHIGTIATNSKGWTKEVNLVSWNGREAKYDIREWSPDHSHMGKGITFTDEEFAILKTLIPSQPAQETGQTRD